MMVFGYEVFLWGVFGFLDEGGALSLQSAYINGREAISYS